VTEVLAARDAGPAPERQVALDMVRRALVVAPIPIVLAALVWGGAGAASVAYAMAVVLANFVLAAWMLGAAARIGYGLLMGVALFGYLMRLGLIFLAVFPVKDAGWVEPAPLGITLVVTHIGLLLWELRYVSASLAFPGLRPAARPATKETAIR
jgi:hypothetical protein